MKRQTSISNHVIHFARFLRTQQYTIGPEEEADVLKGLTAIDWSEHAQFKEVQRAAFCKHFEQYQQFDDHYHRYWSELSKAVDSKSKRVAEEKQKPTQPKAPSIQVIKNWLHGNQQQDEQDVHQASPESVSGTPDLSSLSDHHYREWQEVIQLIQRQVSRQRSRRYIKSKQAHQLDFRKVLKNSIVKGGEITEISFKKQKKRKVNLLLLCDVSRSMELYSRFMIQLMYALQNSGIKIHCFVFSTELFPVSSLLKRQSLKEALSAVSEEVEGWSGGTKIGACFADFLDQHGRKAIPRNTFTFILSDGWDAGEIEVLERSMHTLQRRSKQLFWINPLAKSESFDAKVLGMKAAMPYIDHFIPAVDATSLKRHLKNL
ncbi:MAG: VWA domain-containing protein [Cytophagales bacterium]|nr:VWA domain-containing protein [Cytophagales bacterium]